METFEINGHKLRVAVRIKPTENNEIHWETTVRPQDFDRIKHVDIPALRKAYDAAGYTKEFMLVLLKQYDENYPVAAFIKDEELVGEAKTEFINKINSTDVVRNILRKPGISDD